MQSAKFRMQNVKCKNRLKAELRRGAVVSGRRGAPTLPAPRSSNMDVKLRNQPEAWRLCRLEVGDTVPTGREKPALRASRRA